jgi:ribosomal protein S18 acetylase RimI-like enzyme
MSVVIIEEIREATPSVLDAVRALVPQLSTSASLPGDAEITEIITSPATVLLLAHAGAVPAGMLTLVLFRIPTGVRAIVEDVVVAADFRGRGIGEALTRRAMDRAAEAGARTIDLTSRPSREAANRLYQRLGFVRRDTHVYRYRMEQ